jgi:hypothetical protein
MLNIKIIPRKLRHGARPLFQRTVAFGVAPLQREDSHQGQQTVTLLTIVLMALAPVNFLRLPFISL